MAKKVEHVLPVFDRAGGIADAQVDHVLVKVRFGLESELFDELFVEFG